VSGGPSPSKEQRQGWLAALLAASFFGCSAPLTSLFSADHKALVLAGLLYGGAALVLVPLALLEAPRSRQTPLKGQDWPWLTLITLLGGIAGPIALVHGLALLEPGASALLLNLEALFTLLIAVSLGREHLDRGGWAATVLILGGGMALTQGSLVGSSWRGVAWIALACLCWGIDNNLCLRLSLRNPLQVASGKAVGAAIPMLLVAHGQGLAFPPTATIVALLGIGGVGYGLSIWLDMVALGALGAAREAVVFATAPFLGALVAVIALHSPLNPSLLVAAAAMALGTWLLLRSQHSHRHRHPSQHHDHLHRHDPGDPDDHHQHPHEPEDLVGLDRSRVFRHHHLHRHEVMEHDHPHVSDQHHRHRHN